MNVTSFKREVVENELMKNVHLIGAMYVGDINTCMDFFDQSFVRDGKQRRRRGRTTATNTLRVIITSLHGCHAQTVTFV